MIPNLPTLKILPIEQMILHEDHDLQRTLPLVEKLRAQGILRNPPIVMRLPDNSGRFMVLDGANRVTSLREMEFPHTVAQVVEANNPNVNLQTWTSHKAKKWKGGYIKIGDAPGAGNAWRTDLEKEIKRRTSHLKDKWNGKVDVCVMIYFQYADKYVWVWKRGRKVRQMSVGKVFLARDCFELKVK